MPQNKYCIKNLLNSSLKDNIPPEKKSGIYQIDCKDCKKDIYELQKEIWVLGLKNNLEILKMEK